MNQIAGLLQGAVDIHIHSGPGLIARSLTHDEAVQEAMEAGMRAVVIKDHHHSSANLGHMMEKYVIKDRPFTFIPSLVLNNHAGGLNPYVVDAAINFGAKVIWMPTVSAQHHIDAHAKPASTYNTTPTTTKAMRANPPITILDGDGKLKTEVKDIISLCKDADVVLANGHISKRETAALFEEAKTQGARRLLLDHPDFLLGCTIDEMKEYAREGIWVEHILAILYSGKLTNERLYELITAVGAEHTIISTDLGQPDRPRPLAGMTEFLENMLKLGLTPEQLRLLIRDNPAKLLF